MGEKNKVIIRKCETYDDLDRIRGIVKEGMEELGAKPHGRVLLKPNLIFAHYRYGQHGFTHPNIVGSIIDVIAALPEVEKVTIGERTGVGVPTRYVFKEAGYGPLRKKPKVAVSFFDEDPMVEVEFKKGTVHKKLKMPKALVEADYKIYAPKLKHHVSTKITCSLKLNIGICDSQQRLIGHDWRLEEKIADLYEIGHPNLVVVDGVYGCQRCEVVPAPLPIGIIMMGTSGVAIDSVAARIMGFDPAEINHLRIARERGWEPVSDDDIEIVSEIPLEKIREKTKDLDRTFHDPRTVDTPIRFYFGNYPGGKDICGTGCINMIKTYLAVQDAFSPSCLKQAQPVAVVIGEYEGDVDGQGFPILMVGDCTKIKGEVQGKTRRIKGCPVFVPDFTIPACHYFKIPSPYFDPKAMFGLPYYAAIQSIKKLSNLGSR